MIKYRSINYGSYINSHYKINKTKNGKFYQIFYFNLLNKINIPIIFITDSGVSVAYRLHKTVFEK